MSMIRLKKLLSKLKLLNQISLYENDELSELFFGLEETYYGLTQKEKIHGL